MLTLIFKKILPDIVKTVIYILNFSVDYLQPHYILTRDVELLRLMAHC